MKRKDRIYFFVTSLIVFINFPIIGLTECKTTEPAVTTVMIPMRDGVKLATDLYFPENRDGTFPVILMRTPYSKAILREYGEFFAEHGYIFAIQDVRGRFKSEGNWEPFIGEGLDGYDAIEWLAEQDWSTGKVAMYGGSYSGAVQLFTAVLNPPHLVTIIPNIIPSMPFSNMPYQDGLFMMGGNIRWIDIVEAKDPQTMAQKAGESIRKDWYDLLKHLPVIDLDKQILGTENPYWREWIKHNYNDQYWESVDYLKKLEDLDIPVFLQSGWFDPGNRGTKLAYSSLKKSENKPIKMIMGPWGHTDQSSRYLYGQDMGEEADIGLIELYIKWFDFWLKGEENGILEDPLIQVFNMGPNKWLEADTYPLPGTDFTRFYLTSEDGANSSKGDGKLQLEIPSSEKQYDTYTYDPADPSHCLTDYMKRRATGAYSDLVAIRKDVLVYETQPFENPFTIAGPISTKLYASSSAKDTDWCIMLYGVTEEETIFPIGMTWGVIRASYRNSMVKPELLEEDKLYEYTIDLGHTGYTFSEGERIRMEISSALYPEYSRNLNTGGHNEMETKYVTAEQKIYHADKYNSYLMLPVINAK